MLRLTCGLALLLSLPASAQTVSCDQRERVVAKLTGLGESQTGMGLSDKGQIYEVWASDQTGTWTIVLSDSSGLSCILSYGRDWSAERPIDKI